jgi:hypothetical protein
MSGGMTSVTARIRPVVWGSDESRVRAIWRFLLAWPLLPLVGLSVALVMPLAGVSGRIPGGVFQGVIFLGMLGVWARFVDRRPLSDYGVAATRSWLVRLLVGFGVVVSAWSGWHLLAAAQGWMHIELAMSAPGGLVVAKLVGALVSVAINTWVQDVVFFAIVLKGAAEGFRSRGVDPTRAVLGGWLVGMGFFTAIHGQATVLDTVNSLVIAGVFGLLYLHTGDLALTIGVHWGSSYAAGFVFVTGELASQAPSVVLVSEALPWAKGMATPIYLYLATYLLLVAWLRLRRGEVAIETELAEWTER